MRDGHLWTPWASSPMFLSAAWRLNSSQTQISSAFLLESDFVRPHDTHLILDYVSQGVDSREASDRQNLTAPTRGCLNRRRDPAARGGHQTFSKTHSSSERFNRTGQNGTGSA